MTHWNRSRSFRTVRKLAIAASILLLASSGDAARLCETPKGAYKVKETCTASQTDHGALVTDGEIAGGVTREEFDGVATEVGTLRNDFDAMDAEVGTMGSLKFWQLNAHRSIASDGQRTVIHTAELPAGKWLVGAKIDIVNNDKFPFGALDSYYRCQLASNGGYIDQSTVHMGGAEVDVEVQTVTLFHFVDSADPIQLGLSCGADSPLAPSLAQPYVESGRFWAISVAEISDL